MQSKTLVALFDHLSDARSAVDDLVSAGVPRDSINLVANDASREYESELSRDRNNPRHDGAGTGATIGTVLGGLAGLLVGIGAFAIPGVGPIVAAGPIIATLTGAGAGAATGGIVGSLADLGVPDSDAHTYAEGVRRGGTLVSVKLSEAEAARVSDLLERHNPIDVESRGSTWQQSGWNQQFDPSAAPYEAGDIAAERDRYGIRAPILTDELDEEESPASTGRRSF